MPDSASSESAVSVKPPATPGRNQTVEPVAAAFAKPPKESVGAPDGSAAVAPNAYVPSTADQPAPSAGQLVETTPDSASVDPAVTVKPPVAPARKYTVAPSATAFVKEPKESVGVLGGVRSTWI